MLIEFITMIKLMCFLVLLATTTIATGSVPFPGGMVVIMFDSTPEVPCDERGVKKYPQHTVQYWYGGAQLWQVITRGDQTTITELARRPFGGVGSIYQIAKDIDRHEYDCSYRAEFIPGDQEDMKEALSAISIRVGRLKQRDEVWYWAR